MTVIGTAVSAPGAWLFYLSGTQCRDEWLGHVLGSYLLLIAAPATGVAVAHVARYRSAGRGYRGLEITAIVFGWCVFAIVAGVAGLFALVAILFADGLSC
ncbi:hypothetical protein [Actinoplanes sp. NPDC026670]|uniref:hypothetical protein n=1 Tax=Actinoplanes sp. NPDC026670 TaxID=3154700 RepID=UPI0033E89B83